MAYVSQELKAQLAPGIKAICKKYGVKASIAVRNHTTLVLNIKQGPIDFFTGYNNKMAAINRDRGYAFVPETACIRVNEYHYTSHFDSDALKFVDEIVTAMNIGNHDRSDSQTDYFDVGFYTDISIGSWNTPYVLVA
jgi:hypothetical protein